MGMPVTVKGQVTIPKPIRDRLGLVPGSKVEFDVEADGRVVMRREGAEACDARDFEERVARVRTLAARGWNGMTTEEIMKLTRGEDWGEVG
jgi:AbrB family looped-hinge helix DNA binding protein